MCWHAELLLALNGGQDFIFNSLFKKGLPKNKCVKTNVAFKNL